MLACAEGSHALAADMLVPVQPLQLRQSQVQALHRRSVLAGAAQPQAGGILCCHCSKAVVARKGGWAIYWQGSFRHAAAQCVAL